MNQTQRKTYLLLFHVFLIIEIAIALFAKSGFIRGFIGDYLVVFLVYSFVQCILKSSPLKVAIGVLIFAFIVEILQYYKIVELLNLSNNKIATTVIGTTFSYLDLLAYALGIATILFVELKLLKK